MSWLQQAGRAFRAAALLAVAGLATAAPAEANFLASFSGNTQPYHTAPSAGVGGTVNFAVYDMSTGGSAGDVYGTGAAGIDALFLQSGTGGAAGAAYGTGRYLYLYQTVNNGPSSGSFPISTNTVFVEPTFLGSYGTLTGTSFSTTVLGAPPAGFANPSGLTTGATPTILTGQAGLTAPSLTLGTTSLRAIYTTELVSGAKSVLFGYVSNQAPAIFQTGLIDGGTTANGLAPSAAVPEPSAVVLSLIGLPTVLLLRRRTAKV